MNKNDFQKNKGVAGALLALATLAMSPANYADGKTPKGRYGNHRKATKKGAKHKVGEAFTPSLVTMVRNEFDHKKYHVTPALYRRLHLGNKKEIVPTYKKPHAKPRGRNLVQPMKFFGIGGV